jgi:hypothetical protein
MAGVPIVPAIPMVQEHDGGFALDASPYLGANSGEE